MRKSLRWNEKTFPLSPKTILSVFFFEEPTTRPTGSHKLDYIGEIRFMRVHYEGFLNVNTRPKTWNSFCRGCEPSRYRKIRKASPKVTTQWYSCLSANPSKNEPFLCTMKPPRISHSVSHEALSTCLKHLKAKYCTHLAVALRQP